MKYIWIGMLIIFEIIWLISSIIDIIETARFVKLEYLMDSLEDYTVTFIVLHILALFGFSLVLFIKG